MRVKVNKSANRFQFLEAPAESFGRRAYRVVLDGETIGQVTRCDPGRHPWPFCRDCNGWHGYTGQMINGKYHEVNVSGFSTRRDAAMAIIGARRAWVVSREIQSATK